MDCDTNGEEPKLASAGESLGFDADQDDFGASAAMPPGTAGAALNEDIYAGLAQPHGSAEGEADEDIYAGMGGTEAVELQHALPVEALPQAAASELVQDDAVPDEAEGRQGQDAADDLYGDLYTAGEAGDELLRMQAAGLKERVEEQQTLIDKLTEELRQVKEERQALADERVILVKNMSALFKTAQLEIGRKDQMLRDLRKQEAHWLSEKLKTEQGQAQQQQQHLQQQQHHDPY